ncbi:MAG TPA: phosphoribosylamine--glycine ligase, partial [Allosphingosinicella sp.]
EEAEAAVRDMFDGSLGAAGTSLVIEEFLEGEEASFFALTDGTTIVPFGSAQDHKRVGDGDVGPNTGGMGAYSPASVLTPELEAQAMDEIVRPTVEALAAQGTPYSGVLYAGLMLTAEGPKLIEYNARFGDPECQVLTMRLEGDLLDLLDKTARGRLSEAEPVRMREGAALTVVMAANAYPGTPEKGGPISGLAQAEANGAKVFHAGTALAGAALVANGGRVLNVTALGATVSEARERAYAAVEAIDFPSGFFRRDIGWREVARER